MRIMFAVLGVLALAAAARAEVAPTCTAAPRAKWIPAAEMKARIAALGFTADVFKETKGGCYEIYGRNAEGKRIEVYFDPVTGEIVRQSR